MVRHVIIFGHGHGLQRAIIDESQHRAPERLIMAQHASRHHLRIRTWVTASNNRRITAPHTRTFNHGAALVSCV